MQVGSIPDTVDVDSLEPVELPAEPTIEDVVDEASQTHLTFGDVATGTAEEVPTEQLTEEGTGEPEGLYADFEDGSDDNAEAELETQKGGDQEEDSPRANARIQNLVAERNEAKAQIAAMQDQMASMQKMVVDSETARNEREKTRWEAEERRTRSAQMREAEATLTDFEKYELKGQRKQDAKLQRELNKLRNEFAKKDQVRETKLQEAQESYTQRQNAEVTLKRLDVAVNEMLVDFPDEGKEDLAKMTKAIAMSMSAQFGHMPEEATKHLGQFIKTYQKTDHQRRLAAAKPKGKPLGAGRVTLPQATQATAAPTTQEPDRTGWSLDDHFNYSVHGEIPK